MNDRNLPKMRRWQQAALEMWQRHSYRGIVQVVTGGGKTVFAMHCIRAAFEAGAANTAVIIVPTVALLDQWFVGLQEDLGLSNDEIGLWSGGRRPSGAARVHVMVINTARSVIGDVADPKHVLLIVDECHRVSSPVNARALDYPFAATLGMSATPGDEHDDRLTTVLEPRLGKVIFSYSLNNAYSDRIIAHFDLVNVKVNLLPNEEQKYDRWTRRIRGYLRKNPGVARNDEGLRLLLRQRAVVAARATIRVPVAVRIVEENRGARTLVFHEFRQDAEAILKQLKARGHSATIYHSGIAAGMRRDNLRLFRRGQFDVLVTCRALDEGINIPEVQVAVVASATASMRQRVQRHGRVLRPAPTKAHALVFTIYATDPEESRLRVEAEELTSANSVTWKRMRLTRG